MKYLRTKESITSLLNSVRVVSFLMRSSSKSPFLKKMLQILLNKFWWRYHTSTKWTSCIEILSQKTCLLTRNKTILLSWLILVLHANSRMVSWWTQLMVLLTILPLKFSTRAMINVVMCGVSGSCFIYFSQVNHHLMEMMIMRSQNR